MRMIEKYRSTPYFKSLDASWKEGIAASVMLAVSEYYLIPFGLVLGASAVEIGLLVAIPQLLGSFAQLLAVRIVRWLGSRLLFLVQGIYLQAAILIPMALAPFLPDSWRMEVFILLATLFRIVGNLIGTVWGSLASDYLPAEERGKYFGWRARVTGLSGVISTLAAGILLFAFKEKAQAAAGFTLLFIFIAMARFISGWLMAKMQDVVFEHDTGTSFTFIRFLVKSRDTNFYKFLLYVSSITFATQISAPYFSVYLLRDLNMDYLSFTGIQLASVLGGLVAFPIWGRHADQVGNAKMLQLASFLIPSIPFLWLISPHPLWLGLVEAFSGFLFAGFGLCAVNFIFDAISQSKRVQCLSYFALFCGMAIFAGASLGGLIADRLPPIGGSGLCTLFVISGILRSASHLLLSGKFTEVRTNTQKVSSRTLFFSTIGIKPLFSRTSDTEQEI
ncbi:MAG: MFS transporter [Candidatus Omnitrophica bacterium]|nr:MFS transporter [Candidatus Omnitrophota bacterium]